MKAILVLDEMPKTCSQCPVNQKKISFWYGTQQFCGKTGRRNDSINNFPCPPDWCPLKEPLDFDSYFYSSADDEIESLEYVSGYEKGWNKCLEEIMGTED